jgi:hypothetical protein
MKKFGKILSSVLAASMLISCFAMNVMAASKAHTVTIVPGEVVDGVLPVEVKIDNTEALVQCGYKLTYDSTVFTADTTKVSRVEKCIDKAWLDDIKDTDGDWAYYLGTPTYSVKAGVFNFQWAGAEGVEADYAMDNRVIGKFYLNVADGANGTYTFSLTGDTMDAGETLPTDMICEDVTVTLGSIEPPAPTTKTVAFTADLAAVGKGYMFTVTDTTADLTADTAAFDFTTNIAEAESVTVGLIVENVPVDNVLSAVAKLVF